MNKTKKIAQNLIADYEARKRIFKGLVGGLVLLSVCYVYLIGSITFDVLARKTLEAQAHELNSKVGQLELTSLALSNEIKIEKGLSMGFVNNSGVLFVSADSLDKLARR